MAPSAKAVLACGRGDVLGAGAERRVGRLVEELDRAVGVQQDGRRVARRCCR